MEIRESLAELSRESFHSLRAVEIPRVVGIVVLVVDVLGGVQFVNGIEDARGPDTDSLAGQVLVPFYRHPNSSPMVRGARI